MHAFAGCRAFGSSRLAVFRHRQPENLSLARARSKKGSLQVMKARFGEGKPVRVVVGRVQVKARHAVAALFALVDVGRGGANIC